MAQSYVPEGTMLVCTEMKSPMDNTIVRYRDTADVFQASKKVYLLTEKDLKLQTAFVCNINSKFWGGLGALCAVVALGALAIATVLTGGLALVAFAVAVAAVGTSAFAAFKEIVHDCDFTTTSKWINVHDSVKINGHKALLQNSKLICSKGGAISLVVDPVLARAAAQKIAANNTEEYDAHTTSQFIQGMLFVASSEGDPRALAAGLPLTIYNYVSGENDKQEIRNKEIETRITDPDKKSERDDFLASIGGGAQTAARDGVIGVIASATYDAETRVALSNNATIIRSYPSVVVNSLRSAYPMASLRLNTSLVFRGASNPKIVTDLGKGFAWGVAGAVVDAGYDVYENNLYDNTLDYFVRVVSEENSKSKGINIISKNK